MKVYGTMQGPNEFVVNGTFRDWDRLAGLRESRLPTLLSVGRHDTMKVAHIERMGKAIRRAANSTERRNAPYFFLNASSTCLLMSL